ncbi:MAG: helix-turn-helix transcriptional regulator [Atopobiaceae bacterium]|nr:helix-turn-helix transcriptional regulator [Atopobiaceae bacterium]
MEKNIDKKSRKLIQRKAELRKLGFTIARLREERNITQSELATMLGYTNPAHVSRFESGNKAPSMLILFEIADILEVSIKDFFSEF